MVAVLLLSCYRVCRARGGNPLLFALGLLLILPFIWVGFSTLPRSTIHTYLSRVAIADARKRLEEPEKLDCDVARDASVLAQYPCRLHRGCCHDCHTCPRTLLVLLGTK